MFCSFMCNIKSSYCTVIEMILITPTKVCILYFHVSLQFEITKEGTYLQHKKVQYCNHGLRKHSGIRINKQTKSKIWTRELFIPVQQ